MTTGIGILLGLALAVGADAATPPQTAYQTYYCSTFSSAGGQPSSNHYAFVQSRLESWKLHEEFKAAVKKKNPKNTGFYGACDLMKDAKKSAVDARRGGACEGAAKKRTLDRV